jgi:hypothetical protein
MHHHLHLWFRFFYGDRLPCCLLVYSSVNRYCFGPIKNTHYCKSTCIPSRAYTTRLRLSSLAPLTDPGFSMCVFGGPVRHCPGVLPVFGSVSFLSEFTTINYNIYLFLSVVKFRSRFFYLFLIPLNKTYERISQIPSDVFICLQFFFPDTWIDLQTTLAPILIDH